jgi:hypothetical protein
MGFSLPFRIECNNLCACYCGDTNKCVMKKVSVVHSEIFFLGAAELEGEGRRKSISEEAPVAEIGSSHHPLGQLTYAGPLPHFLLS